MNTVPNAHGTFMAQAIQTCEVGGALVPRAQRVGGTCIVVRHACSAGCQPKTSARGAHYASHSPARPSSLLSPPATPHAQDVLLREDAATARTIVLITDGKPTDNVDALEAARAAKAKGLKMVVVGAGDIDYQTLKELASGPSYVFANCEPACTMLTCALACGTRRRRGCCWRQHSSCKPLAADLARHPCTPASSPHPSTPPCTPCAQTSLTRAGY